MSVPSLTTNRPTPKRDDKQDRSHRGQTLAAEIEQARDVQAQPRADGQAGRQHPQPAMLLLDLRYVAGAAGQPNRHLFTEPERCVVPSICLDRPDRQVGPPRELRRDEP